MEMSADDFIAYPGGTNSFSAQLMDMSLAYAIPWSHFAPGSRGEILMWLLVFPGEANIFSALMVGMWLSYALSDHAPR